MPKLDLYPVKFTPILKDKVWGGSKLSSMFNKDSDSGMLGESWELSGVSGDISVVANGSYRGKDLNELLQTFTSQILGEQVYRQHGAVFPLLFKYIDAKLDLSVQVHPDDSFAKTHHDSFGKTEMWYIMQADPGAQLIVDFNAPISKELYLEHLENKSLAKVLNFNQVEKGDSYFIAPGTIHAICGGVLLAEIQQTSDITYRVYDWDRPDADGNLRELHNDLAVQTLNFEAKMDQQLSYSQAKNTVNPLCKSNFFDTRYLSLDDNLERDLSTTDSFVVYMCVGGSCSIELGGNSEALNTGETVLIPAAAQQLKIITQGAQILEVSVP